MYKRHNIWDEDKWDIHSTGTGEGSSGYAGHSSKTSEQDYHKNEIYNKNEEEDKTKDVYNSMRQEKDKDKKKKDDEEKTIVDAVEQEEKYQKKEKEEEDFKNIAKDIQQGISANDALKNQNTKSTKEKNNKSIEEAIKEAIKEEKEIVHVD